jgi:hypothetical protein
MRIYFDAVLDITLKPVFNGTSEETQKFVEDCKDDLMFEHYMVCIGRTLELVSFTEYLARK